MSVKPVEIGTDLLGDLAAVAPKHCRAIRTQVEHAIESYIQTRREATADQSNDGDEAERASSSSGEHPSA